MRPMAILLTSLGDVVRANPPAMALLGPGGGTPCDELVRAEDAHGRPLCETECARTFLGGEQRDHGIVMVRGQSCRLVCSEVNGAGVISIIPTGSTGGAAELSDREREVLVLVARGFTSVRIGGRLGISSATVRTHVEHIRTKLGVRTRSQAVARALALGQIE